MSPGFLQHLLHNHTLLLNFHIFIYIGSTKDNAKGYLNICGQKET